MKKWFLILFTDTDKKEVYKILELNTIKQVSYLLQQPPQTISNYYHKLIKARGNLRYCELLQSCV
jgi:hypothetical protein